MSTVWFHVQAPDGSDVELRVLDAEHKLACVDVDELLAAAADETVAAPPDLGAFEGLMEVRPNLVAVGDDECNPVWWVQLPDGRGHLATLAYVLGLLDPADRAGATQAHLDVMCDLVDHERAARSLDDGTWDDGDGGYDPRCVACWAEPESHATVLADAVAERARELADALSQFPSRITFDA